MMCTLSSLMVCFLGWFSWLEDGIFIMISRIAWIHDLVGACDSDEVTVQDYFLVLVYIFLVWRGWILWCHRWLGTTVEWEFLALIYLLSVCRCWRFVLDPVAAEAPLTFAWCTWFFMVCGDGLSSWCVEMVASWGLIGFLVKVWFILGVRIVSFFMSWYTLDTRLELWHVIVCSYGACCLFWDG